MEDCHLNLMRCNTAAPSSSDIPLIPVTAAASAPDVPRYFTTTTSTRHPQHHHHHHHQQLPQRQHQHQQQQPQFLTDSSMSLSVESLHSPYAAYATGMGPSRPHSMSSIQTTPIHESPTENEQYTLRRSSDPDPSQSFTPTDEFNRAWPAQQHNHSTFGSDHSMDRSPAIESTNANNNGHWWNDAEKEQASLEAEWAQESQAVQHLASVSQGDEYPTPQLAHSPPAGGSFGTENAIRGDASGPYNSMLYVRQPPSPMLDGEDYTMMNSAGVKLPSVPSPPESPGFHFSAAPSQLHTPELGFPRTPGIPQNCFTTGNYPPPQAYEVHPNLHHHRNASIPPTPPSRPPSTHNNSSAIVAAATALVATSTTANKHHHHHAKTKHGPTRPGGPSRRKGSNSSMRSSAKPHSASSSSGGADEMNFVNFTPHDASRILNGVAPSGSSKTKARREREALEKRRKLSEAAAAAVLAAGGDASALAKVDLL